MFIKFAVELLLEFCNPTTVTKSVLTRYWVCMVKYAQVLKQIKIPNLGAQYYTVDEQGHSLWYKSSNFFFIPYTRKNQTKLFWQQVLFCFKKKTSNKFSLVTTHTNCGFSPALL